MAYKSNFMIILGIETSCDDTAAAVVKIEKGVPLVLSSVISSQTKLHADWGGVVPNLAAREHLKNIIPVIEHSLEESGIRPRDIDLIATTRGPGLIPALLIGVNVAKTLSFVWKKPLLGVNHIEGHIYSNFVGKSSQPKAGPPQAEKFKSTKIKFPILCLVVSGGHTQLVLMKNHLDYKIVGQTLDDAAGEAFDKVARILGLGYPGGPAIAACADKLSETHKLQTTNYKLVLPRPMINSKDFNFSFSGLKTAVLYSVKKFKGSTLAPAKVEPWKNYVVAVACEFQQAVIDVLIAKTIRAAQKYKPITILLAGGVSANKELRKQLGKAIKSDFSDAKYLIPDTKYSVDNAAMIAAVASFRWKKMSASQKKQALHNWKKIETNANLKLI